MEERREKLPLNLVEFDDENPRIRGALEKYGDKINAERIHFALQSSSDEGAKNLSGFHQLKTSIKANNGIAEPIKVVPKDNKMICIDGNTRLAIYRDFASAYPSGAWDKIPAIILSDTNDADIDKIRITSHLMGARRKPPYERARYLKKLRYKDLMDFEQIIALCGGNKNDIEMQIAAFDDMNKFYKDKVPDSEFKIDRFSGFVELQKRGLKEAIYVAGFDLADFGNWISKGNIHALQDVRLLPKVLKDEEARQIFITGGIESIKTAARYVDDKVKKSSGKEGKKLDDASLEGIADALRIKLENMTLLEIDKLKGDDEFINSLESLIHRLNNTLDYVGK